MRPGFKMAWVLLALSLSLAPSKAAAQAGIEVTVFSHESARALTGVEVRLENAEIALALRAVTDPQGKVRFAPLSTAGAYTVEVSESPLHYGAKTEAFSLRANFIRSVSLELTARARSSESVTVTAAHGSTEMNAVNGEVSAGLGRDEIESIAVEGRDTTRVLYRLPNVTQATGFYPEAPNVSINGANGLYANYMLDGMDNNENFLGGQKFAVPVGFVQEVTVLTSNYSTEFGRTGNGIFNITSRSGQNEAHGEVFYLTRPGPSLDAASPFAQRDLSGNPVKDGFQRQQGGFAFGGPMVKDRTFFMANAEYSRDRKDNLLTAPELGVNEAVRGHNDFLYLSLKVDHRWNSRWTASARVNAGQVTIERQGGGLEGGATFPSAGNFQDRNSMLGAVTAVYAGRSFTSETSAQYSRFRWNYGRAARPGSAQTVVLDPAGQTIAILGNPGYVFDDTESTVQAQEKVTYRAGRHSFKGGVDLVSADFALAGGGNQAGNYTVQLTEAQLAAVRALGKGSALDVPDIPADAQVLDYSVELRPASFGTRQNLLALYAEDAFAAATRLTLTLGLRYDYDGLSKGGAASGDKNNLAVRGGFNYQAGHRSVVRGGYGIFYEKNLYAVYSDALQQNSTSQGYRRQLEQLIALGRLPSGTDLGRVTFDGNLTANRAGVPYLAGPGAAQLQGLRESVVSSERRLLNPAGYPNPKTQQVSLGYQKQFGRLHLLYLDLIHSRSDGLARLRDLNAPSPFPLGSADTGVRSPAEADASRPVATLPGGARSILVTENGGKARYYAATVTWAKERGGDPYAFRASYSLSRLRNDTDDINFRAQDANDFAAEYGPSLNDRRHVISAVAWAYPLTRLSVSLASLLQSGQPLNRIPDARVFGTTDLNGDGRGFADAYLGNSDRWPGSLRNQENLPWSFVFDFGVQYRILGRRGRSVELQADIFNLFNRTNLSGYSNNATQSNQIQIGPPGRAIVAKNAGPKRQFQFGVRYVF